MLCQSERQHLAEASRKFFLHGFASPETEALVDRILLSTGRQNKRACILMPRLVVWLVVSMSLFRSSSILNVFERLITWTKECGPMPRRGIVSEEAVYHARSRLGALPLKLLFRELSPKPKELPASYSGLRVFGIDGTNFNVPDTAKNAAVFRRHTSQNRPAAYPQVQGVFLSELSTHQLVDCCYMPCLSNEISTIPFLLKNLGAGDLLLLDRGFASFKTLSLCQRRGVNFLVRVHKNWKPAYKKKLGNGDHLVDLKPTGKARDEFGSKPLPVRLLEFTIGESKIIRLATNLTNPMVYCALDLARLYHRRWECEVTYKEMKSELLLTGRTKMPTHFRSKSPIGVLQECWGMAVAHLLTRHLMVCGAIAESLPPLSLSFTSSLATIKTWLPRFQRKRRKGFRNALVRDIGNCKIDRPRRPRRFPRVVKRAKGRVVTKNETHKETPLDLTVRFHPRAS